MIFRIRPSRLPTSTRDLAARGFAASQPSRRARRRLGFASLLLALTFASCTGAAPPPQKPSGKEFQPAAIPITTAPVTPGSIAATLVYSGNVQSRAQVNVVPKITGRVERLFVDVGDEVRQGETIAELDRATLDAQVQQAEAAVAVAQARLAQAQTGAKPEDVEAAQATVRQAEARLDQAIAGARPEEVAAARAQVGQAQTRLEALIAGPKPDDAAGLDAAIDQARSTVDQTRAQLASAMATMTEARYRLDQARAGLGGPNTRAEDITAGQASLNAARSRLDNLRAGPRPEDLRAAELAVTRAQANLVAANEALEACGRVVSTTRSRSRNSATGQTTETVSQQRQSCSESQRDQLEAQRNAARIAVAEAQNTLERTRNGATVFDVQQAEEAVRQAEATLQRTRFGGTTDLATLELRYGTAQADAERLQASLEQAQANLEAAQARADSARNPSEFDVRNAQETVNQAVSNLARLVNPNPFDVRAAQAQVDQAQAALASRQNPTPEDVQIAAAGLDQAVAALEAARVNQAETVVRAPFDGVVAQRLVSPGATVGTNTPIVSLVSRDVEIVIQVEEARIGQVERGQPAQISVAAFPDQAFAGTVASISPTADPRSRTFSVRVYPVDPTNPLRDGMFAQVALQTAVRQSLLVPVQSVVNRSGRNIVFVVGPDSRVQSQEVQVGINNGRQVEIIGGLNGGEEVATSALDVLSDGTPVVATRQE
ncbi:MAG: efflux RND transporter periplasmic adaptor subunit [Chloroflexota bacterium]|nr:efflux RND transporter periplasmic adaptor subunit [Chloroflexota bacterium]